MKIRNIGVGAAVTTAILASSFAMASPAEALTFGDTLFFSIDDSENADLATLKDPNTDGIFQFDVGTLSIDNGSATEFGSPGSIITDAVINLQQTASDTYELITGTSVEWLSELGDGDGGTTRTYSLTSFKLITQKPNQVGSLRFTADFDGFFQPPTPGVQGIGGLGGSGKLLLTGADNGGDISVVPTPAAVLPALFGMGTAAFRKKKREGEEELAFSGIEEA